MIFWRSAAGCQWASRTALRLGDLVYSSSVVMLLWIPKQKCPRKTRQLGIGVQSGDSEEGLGESVLRGEGSYCLRFEVKGQRSICLIACNVFGVFSGGRRFGSHPTTHFNSKGSSSSLELQIATKNTAVMQAPGTKLQRRLHQYKHGIPSKYFFK